MADADKMSPGSQHEVKRDNRAHDKEPELTTNNRPQQRSRVSKSMDGQHRQDNAMIDRWFDRQLNQLYSDVISEPLPKEFVELIEQLRDKSPKNES